MQTLFTRVRSLPRRLRSCRPSGLPARVACTGGYSFIELLVVVSILFILASAAMPLAQVASQRQREIELRRNLREMRTAIDKFKDSVDQGLIPSTEITPGSEEIGRAHV